MTNLSNYINDIEGFDVHENELNNIINKLRNSNIILVSGDTTRKINANSIKNNENIQDEILELSTAVDTSIPLSTSKNYGNLWTYILSRIEEERPQNMLNTQLEDYLITPRISYYDEEDKFSTKRDVIRSYEHIIYNTNLEYTKVNSSPTINIFRDINENLFSVPTPDTYIDITVPVRYNYIRFLDDNYTIFNDKRDDLLKAVFNNTIFNISDDELYTMMKRLAILIIKKIKTQHAEYIQKLEDNIKEKFGELGNNIIDFSKLFNDTIGDYTSALYDAGGEITRLITELYQNYSLDLTSDNVEISTPLKLVLEEMTRKFSYNDLDNIECIEDIKNLKFLHLLTRFFNKSEYLMRLATTMISEDVEKLQEKECFFIDQFLKNSDKNKYTYTENFIMLYYTLRKKHGGGEE